MPLGSRFMATPVSALSTTSGTANTGRQALRGLLAFHRSWEREGRREVLGAPRRLPALPSDLDRGEIPSLASLGLEQEVDDPPKGGEHEGRKRLERFLARDVSGYGENRDALCSSSTSRLSPYLHFGCISAREVENRLGSDGGSAAFRRQLCWRDFYHHVLHHFPRNATSEFQPRYRGKIKWSHAERRFVAWCEGRTGYPLVDAGMRQLRREGWMHNRARLLVGSFLTKDLGIDWRWGERHFMRLLVDGDEAKTTGIGSGSPRWGPIPNRPIAGSTTRRARWRRTTLTEGTSAATFRSLLRPRRLHPRTVDDAGPRTAGGGLCHWDRLSAPHRGPLRCPAAGTRALPGRLGLVGLDTARLRRITPIDRRRLALLSKRASEHVGRQTPDC